MDLEYQTIDGDGKLTLILAATIFCPKCVVCFVYLLHIF